MQIQSSSRTAKLDLVSTALQGTHSVIGVCEGRGARTKDALKGSAFVILRKRGSVSSLKKRHIHKANKWISAAGFILVS